MPGFDAYIGANKRNTVILIVIFALFLGALGYVFGYYFGSWVTGVAVAVAVTVTMTAFSLFGGAGTVLAISGAKRIEKRDAPQLFNVVEEVSIAAGVPMPKVYVINDTAPNAFATGRGPKNASVAITSGLLSKLRRDELQGVMAHEMSHVRHHDILFAMMMAVMVGLRPVIGEIEACDRDLARQLRRAASSVVLNIGEGGGSFGGTRRERYRNALGSARETGACLDVAMALGYVEAVDARLLDQLDKVRATLVKVA